MTYRYGISCNSGPGPRQSEHEQKHGAHHGEQSSGRDGVGGGGAGAGGNHRAPRPCAAAGAGAGAERHCQDMPGERKWGGGSETVLVIRVQDIPGISILPSFKFCFQFHNLRYCNFPTRRGGILGICNSVTLKCTAIRKV